MLKKLNTDNSAQYVYNPLPTNANANDVNKSNFMDQLNQNLQNNDTSSSGSLDIYEIKKFFKNGSLVAEDIKEYSINYNFSDNATSLDSQNSNSSNSLKDILSLLNSGANKTSANNSNPLSDILSLLNQSDNQTTNANNSNSDLQNTLNALQTKLGSNANSKINSYLQGLLTS